MIFPTTVLNLYYLKNVEVIIVVNILSLWLLLASFINSSSTETDAAKEAIILTTVPKFAGFPDTHHMVMIPGTPYDLMRNETMYQHEAAFSSQPFSRFQSCDVDYSRSKLYMYDKRYSEIVAISNIDTETGFANSQTTKLHVGVSRGDVKIAVDWVSHNIYWTDPMFRQIVMQRTEPNLDKTSLYRVIVKEDLDRPYGLAVDPVGGYVYHIN